jgi:hypothetical protein
MRAEELLNTLTDEELKKRANGCFIQAENTNLYQQAGPEEKQRLLIEANFYLNALIRRGDDRVSRRDFRMEVGVMVLIGLEIVLSVFGLWVGYQQDKVLDKQTTALTHMDASTAATSDSLQKLIAAQDASLKILQQEQAERAKKPRLALHVGNIPLDRASVRLKSRGMGAGTVAEVTLLLKNEGDAAIGAFRIHALVPVGVTLERNWIVTVPESEPQPSPLTLRFTLELLPLRAGETVRIQTAILVSGVSSVQSAFKIPFTFDTLELQAVAPLGSLTVLPPTP